MIFVDKAAVLEIQTRLIERYGGFTVCAMKEH